MTSAQSSQDMRRGCAPQPLAAMWSRRPRHRSESRRRSGRRRQAAPKCDRFPGVLHEGASVHIYSRSADKWVDGELVELLKGNCVRVEYEVDQFWCGKTLHLHSEHLEIIPSLFMCSTCGPDIHWTLNEHAASSFSMVAIGHRHSRPTDATTPVTRLPIPSVPRSMEEPSKDHYFQGCRAHLPAGCRGKAGNYYVDLDHIWTLLEQERVVLIKGSWLLEQSMAEPSQQLPCRQDLPCSAIADVRQLRTLADEDKYPWIVAISHCWLNRNHPDPSGLLLQELAPVIQAFLEDKSWWASDFEGAFFFAWCSIFQPYHRKHANGKYYRMSDCRLTKVQEDSHRMALEDMDIWYTHARTEVWMLTKYFDGQGPQYADRGWTTWESRVSNLITGSDSVLDLGMLNNAESRHSTDMNCIRNQCKTSRRPPLPPEEFSKEIAQKIFTCGNTDRKIIKGNYQRNFSQAMGCIEVAFLSRIGWNAKDIFVLSRALRHCSNLRILYLNQNAVGDDGACGLADGRQHCKTLQEIHLYDNCIGDSGACGLASGLQHCQNLRGLNLVQNQIGDAGACGLSDSLRDCKNLEWINLEKNRIGDVGASRLRDILWHCSCFY